MHEKSPVRYPVDNAAQIFVNIASEGETTLSRISFIMEQPVDRQRLQQAIAAVVPRRFPFFQVYLRKTFFSFVLEHTDDIPPVEDDSYYTNRFVDFHARHFLFRFRTDGRSIALELSHILSDGYGTLVMLETVVAEYLRLGGIEVEEHPLVADIGEPVLPEEWQCAYEATFDPKGPPQKVGRPAYIPGYRQPAIPYDRYHSTRFIFDIGHVRAMAREHHVTVAVFMSGVYLWAIQELYLEDLEAGRARPGQPLRFQFPVNLRRDYPTRSLKNFSYIYSPEYRIRSRAEARKTDELIAFVSEFVRHERHSHSVENQIRRNLRASANPLLKYMPLALREKFMALFYQLFARQLFSGVLTNLGEVSMPPAMSEHVAGVDIMACNSPAPGRNSSLFSYRGRVEINVGSTVEDTRLEDALADKFRSMGLDFELITKRGPAPAGR